MSEEIVETGKELTPEQYWKWRLSIEEMKHAQTRCEVARLRVREKELERTVEGHNLKASQREHAHSKEEYTKVKKEIEESLGLSLNDAIIDPYTFQVKHIKKGSA